MTAWIRRKGECNYESKMRITHCIVHPNYNGDPKSGYDIAICFLERDKEFGSQNFNVGNYSDK